jgi:lipopolysaccharide assembly outer membrane protein LptD (OstA)
VQAGEIRANQIQRDPYGMIHAQGDVQLRSHNITIKAAALSLDVESQAGDLTDAKVVFDSGEKISGKELKRIDLEKFRGKDVTYTLCPDDDLAWSIVASSASLDNDEGVFRAKHARFEWGGIPVLYTPYWEHALTRRSGLLMPSISQSTRRGVEVATPFYWAGAPNWDMTLTPRFMTLRGTMADVEWRHRSSVGGEKIHIQSIHDKETGDRRGRVRTDMAWRFSDNIDAALNIDAVSDGLYTADFPLVGDRVTTAYLTSSAQAVWRDGSDSIIFSSRYQQILGGLSNATTLQVLPRLQTRHVFDIGDSQVFQVDHQSTKFDRRVGVSGLRSGIRPSWVVPWQMYDGAINATWTLNGQYVAYQTDNFTSTNSSYGAVASSLQVQSTFEKISDDHLWRHEIKPILRIDASSAQDQSAQPSYDSSLLPLTFANILRGNRYSGWDRFERMGRVSLVLDSALQNKAEDEQVDTVLRGQVGLVWDGLQESVDSSVAPATRSVSNLLLELMWAPAQEWNISAGGQHAPGVNKWVEMHSSLRWHGLDSSYFNLGWQKTDVIYAQQSETYNVSGKVNWDKWWSSHAVSRYDALRKHMIHTTVGLAYRHACWDMVIEGFKSYQVGTNSITDVGGRLLLAFEGLGSFGGER